MGGWHESTDSDRRARIAPGRAECRSLPHKARTAVFITNPRSRPRECRMKLFFCVQCAAAQLLGATQDVFRFGDGRFRHRKMSLVFVV